jgi:hypothetical protein
MTDEITYSHGLLLRKGGLVFSIILFIFSIGLMSNNNMPSKYFIAPILFVLGLICLSTTGIRFDLKNRTVTQYVCILGFTRGKKISLSEFCYLTIIRQNYSIQSISKGGSEVNSSQSSYNLLLTNKSFFKKIVINHFDNLHYAQKEGQDLSKYLNLELVNYDPPVSRRRRK